MNQASLKIKNVLFTYADRLRCFHPNARYYLVSVILTGAALGVYRLLFNFFVLSLGYDENLLGTLITTSSLTALLAALPMGYVVNYLGRKTSLITGGVAVSLAVGVMVLWPSTGVFIAMNVLMGLAQSLTGVTMGPFLMENSTEKERTYLFSFASGLQMASGFFGNWIGGVLPTWMSTFQPGSTPTSPGAYSWALGVIAIGALIGVLPLFMLRTPRVTGEAPSIFAPLSFFKKNSKQLTQLVLPMLVTSIGAGLIMPFMNVFFRNVHHQSDSAIGGMFAWGSLAMGIGLMIAPPLADRFGKIEVVVVTQALSIPFLFLLGFSPVFQLSAAAYYVRLTLMNMSSPVYQTFVMEQVDHSARATVASLVSMANSVGWAFSPQISGWLQVNYGFQPAYAATIVLYMVSIYLYWRYFLHPNRKARVVESPQVSEGLPTRGGLR